MSHLSRACSFERDRIERRPFSAAAGSFTIRGMGDHRRLRRNPSTARAIVHTILPERISATPNPDGGWTFDVMNYRAVLEERGSRPPPTAAVMEALRGEVG